MGALADEQDLRRLIRSVLDGQGRDGAADYLGALYTAEPDATVRARFEGACTELATEPRFLVLALELIARHGLPFGWKRDELAVLGFFAREIEKQAGTDGRPPFALLVEVWARMAADGDAQGRLILESLIDHPRVGGRVRALLAGLPQ
jgi:hypothetical protein